MALTQLCSPKYPEAGFDSKVRQHPVYLTPDLALAPEWMQACAEYTPAEHAWSSESSSTEPTLNFCPNSHLQLVFEFTGSLFYLLESGQGNICSIK